MMCLKYFSDEDLVQMIINFNYAFRTDLNEDYMCKINDILDELESREVDNLYKNNNK